MFRSVFLWKVIEGVISVSIYTVAIPVVGVNRRHWRAESLNSLIVFQRAF